MTQGERIRGARHRLKLTQVGLADRIGVHQSSVAYWESGKTRPRSAALLDLATALDVAPEWLEFGSSFGASEAQIPVVGALLHGAVRRPRSSTPDGTAESVAARMDGGRMVAVKISDNSLEPAYHKGDFVLGPLLSGGDMVKAAGRDCVVQFWDGRFNLKRLGSDSSAGGFGKTAVAVDLSRLQEIAWCMPVEWIHRPIPENRNNSDQVGVPGQSERTLEAVT